MLWARLFKAGLSQTRVSMKIDLKSVSFIHFLSFVYNLMIRWSKKKRENHSQKRLLNKEMKKAELKFNPRLVLIGL